MYLMEKLFKLEFNFILILQEKLQVLEPFLAFISQYLGPSILSEIVGPILGAFHQKLLLEFMVVGTFADILGLLLKWIIDEDRPYWWVQETSEYMGLTRPTLRQHKLTCESTSGNPSGHSTASAVFFFYLLKRVMRYYYDRKTTNWDPDIAWLKGFFMFLFLSIIMWVSRMYFGCHFFHQCFLGSIIGLFMINTIGQASIHKAVYTGSKTQAVLVALALSAIAGLVYLIKLGLGSDPHWSVRMAFKWCENPQHLKHESTAIYALVKHIGVLFGLALSSPLKKDNRWKHNHNLWIKIPLTILTVIVNQLLLSQTPKNYGRLLFLSYVFFTNFLFGFTLTTIIPKLSKDKFKNE